MKSISPEKKLELVRRIREESNQNQSLIAGRETILGTSEGSITGIKRHSLMKLRIMSALLLFLFCIWAKYGGGGEFLQYDELQTALQQEIELNAIDFMDELPYTLTNADASADVGTMRIEEGQ